MGITHGVGTTGGEHCREYDGRDPDGAVELRDPLTGLYNRRYLEESLSQSLARAKRESVPLSVLVFDVDELKAVNAAYGRDAGDAVLRKLSRHLDSRMRAGDTTSRYGNDEFIVVMHDAALDDALTVAEQWRHFVETSSPFWGLADGVSVTISAGVSSTATASTRRDLVSQAKAALLEAKGGGQNSVLGHDRRRSSRF